MNERLDDIEKDMIFIDSIGMLYTTMFIKIFIIIYINIFTIIYINIFTIIYKSAIIYLENEMRCDK